MQNSATHARVVAEIEHHRAALLDLAVRASVALSDASSEVALSHILIGCRFILDRAMNAVWTAHNSSHASAQKANVYFPQSSSAEKFQHALNQYQLPDLKAKNQRAYDLIRSKQPWMTLDNRWLKELFDLTKCRHEGYVEIESSQSGEVQFGVGQSGHIRSIVMTPNGFFADTSMVNNKTGLPEPLNMSFVDRFNHVISSTRLEPVSYCRECLDNTEKTAIDLFTSLL